MWFFFRNTNPLNTFSTTRGGALSDLVLSKRAYASFFSGSAFSSKSGGINSKEKHLVQDSDKYIKILHDLKNNEDDYDVETFKQSDLTEKHQFIVATTCENSECTTKNCSPNGDSKCIAEHLSPEEKALIMKNRIVGNYTSNPPKDKGSVLIDSQHNYSGANKPQHAVILPVPKKIKSGSIIKDEKSTSYIQEKKHYDALMNSIPSDNTAPLAVKLADTFKKELN